ncbi:hypothetical protein CORC01_11038 [Colletotrichum orchidophilum]|uniref:Uncharacterized protein n=1 Tax=Colletotrichum orchidophilum TaxID=1209926 RepID=A0A1G4AWZ8_9PEZI|nr:uncharacterized protein CORC01_11038 [Colletotrichum orchidophilum]OHE93635.1 hypothetical protein CORC01_11038 [Colletotrichum orchidophilum]
MALALCLWPLQLLKLHNGRGRGERTSDIGSQRIHIGGQNSMKLELAISELGEVADARVHANGGEGHASSPGGLAIAA